jgi:DNA-binding MarR family transcriptional regulator
MERLIIIIMLESDRDIILLDEIASNREISQRELSCRTGLSLGTVNLLINKMIREGLIKMETIPTSRVIYMLTPKGMTEKAAKTVRYIRKHYHIIQQTKEMIIEKLNHYHHTYIAIYIHLPGNELDNLIESAISEYRLLYPNRIIEILKIHNGLQLNDLLYNDKSVILSLSNETGYRVSSESTFTIPQASLLDVPI